MLHCCTAALVLHIACRRHCGSQMCTATYVDQPNSVGTMTIRSISSSVPAGPIGRPALAHDHSQCIESALSRAEQLCAEAGARLTPLRHRVLELIWASHKPLGAYDLLDQLAREGHKPAPPTIYRALDFLLEHRLIHRLASLNAFLGCSHPGDAHAGYFLICQACGNTEEVTDSAGLQQAIRRATDAAGFAMQQGTLELSGLCQQCRND